MGHASASSSQTARTVDLDVSPKTLFAILHQALAERPDGVEILVRFGGGPAPAVDQGAATEGAARRR